MAEGLDGVVAASTRLSRVDGEAGQLIIAGYALEDLAPNVTFEEVAYLLLHGRLPKPEEGRSFARKGEDGTVTSMNGMKAFEVVDPNGVVTFQVAELNLFRVIIMRPDGFYQSASNIDFVEPDPRLFRPPDGAVVVPRGPLLPPSALK